MPRAAAPRRRRAKPALRPEPAPPTSAAEGLALARRSFLLGERVTPERLAGELGISRATAYRRFGNAEELAGQVVAGLAEATSTVRRARRGAAGPRASWIT